MNYCNLEAMNNSVTLFERNFDRIKKYNPTFSSLVCQIFDEEKALEFYCNDQEVRHVKLANKSAFARVTGLSPAVYSRIRAGGGKNGYVPKLTTLVTICVVYNLGLTNTETLLATLGRSFNKTSKVHEGYKYILSHLGGRSLDEANRFLEAIGIEEQYLLGARSTQADRAS